MTVRLDYSMSGTPTWASYLFVLSPLNRQLNCAPLLRRALLKVKMSTIPPAAISWYATSAASTFSCAADALAATFTATFTAAHATATLVAATGATTAKRVTGASCAAARACRR